MTSLERKKLQRSLGSGLILIVLIVLIQAAGGLRVLDNYIYDVRSRHFQMFMPAPTDRLVHLDITDRDLMAMGTPPWPRSYFGQIADTLRAAGAVVVGFDLILSEPNPEEDAIFAKSLQDWKYALIPVPFEPHQPQPKLIEDLQAEYVKNLEIDSDTSAGTEDQGRLKLVAAMRRLGHRVAWPTESDTPGAVKVENIANRPSAQAAGDQQASLSGAAKPTVHSREEFEDACIAASRFALYQRMREELAVPTPPTRQELRQILLPKTPAHVHSALVDRFNEMYDKVQSMLYLERLAIPATKVPAGVHPVPSQPSLPPVPTLSAAASITGFVEFPPEDVLRRLPLLSQNEGYVYPQFGLALACATLGVDVQDIRIEPQQIVIPVDGRPDIVLPTHARVIEDSDGEVLINVMMDVPYFGDTGTHAWMTMYDWPNHEESRQHVPTTEVWEIIENRRKNEQTNQTIDNIIEDILVRMDPAWLERYKAERPPLTDTEARAPTVDRLIADVIDFVLATDIESLGDEEKKIYTLLANHKIDLQQMIRQNRNRSVQIEEQMAQLKQRFHGKTVILGYTATGILADFVPTTLHSSCPGAVVHGAIFNAIMTGEIWHRAPGWLPLVLTVVFGILAALIASSFGPTVAPAATVVLGAVYILVDGVLLFDYGNIILDSAGPIAALAGVWAGVSITGFVTEQRERGRITKRFASYVDPKLVDYVLEHDEDVFAGQEREMTVVFTDLAGFTSLTEKLGPGVVPVLNEYIELVVPIITENDGLVNKFLGDGIMFFHNAPRLNPFHAHQAVTAAFQMQDALVGFNEKLKSRGLPTVAMRVGINSDLMIVGDAGGAKRADYTVLGDSVNLAARLESANKQTGTLMMVGERTADLVRDEVLLRPLGSLQVVGKTRGVKVFEPLAPLEKATQDQHRLTDLTARVIRAYEAADFEACREAIVGLEEAFGPSKLTGLYRELCEQFITNPPEMPFHGSIVLTSK